MRINVDIQGINVDIHGINVDIDGINVDKWGHLSEFQGFQEEQDVNDTKKEQKRNKF